MKKIIGYYSLLLGISVIGLWVMILLTSEIEEGPKEMSLHLVSEFAMAIVCLIGGWRFMKNTQAFTILLVGHSMVLYSTLNAAGYYWQRDDIIMTLMLSVFFLASLFVVLYMVKGKVITYPTQLR